MIFTHNPVPLLEGVQSTDTPKGRYYTTLDGAKYPSITTVLGSVEKPAIADWRNRLGPQKADAETKRAADRGSAIHAMIEKYLMNEENPTEGFDPVHQRDFNQVRLRLHKISNILCQEGALYSDLLKVAGRVDCIGDYDGTLSVIDFKTSNGNKTEAMIHDYFMQTAAYAIMFQERYNIQIDDIVIIMSVEKTGIPLIFKQKVDLWIEPLCERINNYYNSIKA